MANLAPIVAQVDATLVTVADAIACMQYQTALVLDALSVHDASSEEVVTLAAKLKDTTDVLAVAVKTARESVGIAQASKAATAEALAWANQDRAAPAAVATPVVVA